MTSYAKLCEDVISCGKLREVAGSSGKLREVGLTKVTKANIQNKYTNDDNSDRSYPESGCQQTQPESRVSRVNESDTNNLRC